MGGSRSRSKKEKEKENDKKGKGILSEEGNEKLENKKGKGKENENENENEKKGKWIMVEEKELLEIYMMMEILEKLEKKRKIMIFDILNKTEILDKQVLMLMRALSTLNLSNTSLSLAMQQFDEMLQQTQPDHHHSHQEQQEQRARATLDLIAHPPLTTLDATTIAEEESDDAEQDPP